MNLLRTLHLPGFLLMPRIQNLLFLFNLLGKLLFQPLGSIQLHIDRILIIHDFRNLVVQLLSLLAHTLRKLSGIADLRRCLIRVHLRRILNDISLLKLVVDFIHFLIITGALLAQQVRRRFHLVHLTLQLFNRPLKFLHLTPSAEQITGILERASCHGTSGINQFPLQGNNPKRLFILLRNGKPMVNMFHHKRPPQKVIRQRPVFFLHLHQRICRPHNAGLMKSLRLDAPCIRPDVRKRKECGPSKTVLLQKPDHPLRRPVVRSHNILDIPAQSRLDGNLILLVHLD